MFNSGNELVTAIDFVDGLQSTSISIETLNLFEAKRQYLINQMEVSLESFVTRGDNCRMVTSSKYSKKIDLEMPTVGKDGPQSQLKLA